MRRRGRSGDGRAADKHLLQKEGLEEAVVVDLAVGDGDEVLGLAVGVDDAVALPGGRARMRAS
jgi:hypothetical protein